MFWDVWAGFWLCDRSGRTEVEVEECKDGQNGQEDEQTKVKTNKDRFTKICYANLMFGMSGQGFCLMIKVDGHTDRWMHEGTDRQKERQTNDR